MELKEYYQSVISELEGHLLSSNKVYEDNLVEVKAFLKEKSFADNDINFIVSFMNNFYRLGKSYASIESDLDRYKQNLVEAEKKIGN